MMTLDEAIEHCEGIGCSNTECAAEHRQLAKWLKELKEKRSETLPKLTDGIGRTRLGFTYVQIQAIEGYVRRSVDFIHHPQNRWKPSEEQIKALEHAINCYSGISPTNTDEVYALEIMKEQLKKLKG